jgi:alpha-amylase
VYGDDGEKFGGWPGTHDWVYNKGWLKRFFAMLTENRDWIDLITPSQVLENLNPLGKIYIPDSSYREMMEWALPPEAGIKYENAVNNIKNQPVWGDASLFFRGGFWRNFKYKYPEANQMYARMLEVSNKISASKNKAPESARKQLYMSQCNCPYWHGVFGGLYLNHLRFETYRNIIRADDAVNKVNMKKSGRLSSEEQDFDLDGRNEIVLQNDWHRIYIQPHGGGKIYEWDFYPAYTNLLDTLSRRPETYHQKILEASESRDGGESYSIHDLEKLHDPTIKEHLTYDNYEHKSFLDHFITGEISPSKLRRNEVNIAGNYATGEYKSDIAKSGSHIIVTQSHSGIINFADTQIPVDLTKSLKINKNKSQIECEYKIVNNGSSKLECSFGMEWNFAMLAGNADDRYYFCGDKLKSGKLTAELETKNVTRFGLADEWQLIKVAFEFDQAVTLYTFPIETVSQSESAFEKVYQSSVFYPVVELNLNPGEIKQISVNVSVDFPI